MSKHLERDLGALEHDILAVSALVEEMIGKACRAIREGRSDLAREVIESDPAVDKREVHIEESCLKILALHQPVAIDLRRAASILKINNDIERIADLAVNIAQRAEFLDLGAHFAAPKALHQMAEVATGMVRDALDSFVNLSPKAARRVCLMDDRVDAFNVEVTNKVYKVMRSDPQWIEPSMAYFATARDIERIADHATNIAEDVIYLVEGEIARHGRKQTDVQAGAGVSASIGS